MIWKRYSPMLVGCSLFLLSGCMALNGPLAYRYVPSLSNDLPLPFRVSLEQFRDERPALLPEQYRNPAPSRQMTGREESGDSKRSSQKAESMPGSGDRETTRRIEPVDAQVTMTLLEDFRESRFFESVDFIGSRQLATLLMRGATKRFTWDEFVIPIPIIFPEYTSATVTLSVQLIDPHTDKVLTEYEKSETVKDSFYLFTTSAEAGTELASALKSVSQQIKTAIRADYIAGKLGSVSQHGP
jgi:hypothetical protein